MRTTGRQLKRAWRVWALWLDGPRATETQEMLFDDPPEVNATYTDPKSKAHWKCLWVTEA